MGIKGFCAVNGVHASTSERCTRALVSDEAGVQMDQQSLTRGATACSSFSFGEVCSCCCPGDEAEHADKQEGQDNGSSSDREVTEGGMQMVQSEHEASRRSMLDSIAEKLVGYKVAVYDVIWNEIRSLPLTQLIGEEWRNYMVKKLFQMDFMLQCIVGNEDCGNNDQRVGRIHFLEAFTKEVMDMVGLEAQIDYFLLQQGLQMEETDRKQKEQIPSEAGSGEEISHHVDALGSTEDVSQDVEMVADANAKEKKRSYYGSFAQRKKKHEQSQPVRDLRDGHDERCDEDLQTEANGVPCREDIYGCIHLLDTKEIKKEGCTLRGGMANRFQCLAQEEDEEDADGTTSAADNVEWFEAEEVDSIEQYTEDTECSEQISEDDVNPLDSSHDSSISGKSYYAEFFERKANMRGGAGGSSTTKNKQLTKALDALADVVKHLEPTQREGPEEGSPEDVIDKINELVAQWKEKTPTRSDMREQLRKMHVLLEKDIKKQADPKESREFRGESVQQSFYGDFVKRLREDNKDETNKGTSKGKGKGKGKNKSGGKAPDNNLPKFDVKKIFPTKALTTWQLLSRELEQGKEPTGAAVILDSCEKMAEYQSLAKAHGIRGSVTMIAKATEDKTNIVNAVEVWLPYIGNIALAKAVIATTSGTKTTMQGMDPIKKDAKNAGSWEKKATLRITVDLWLIAESKVREHFKKQPHAAMHHAMVKTSCKEIKTHGWVVGDSLLTGYCTTSEEDANTILAQSGTAGVFAARLRQDVTEQPPVTWVKKEENESVIQYHERVMAKAKEVGVAAARRAGGGAFLGYLCEDDTPRNHAWQIAGIPFHWGPTSVRQWLESVGWVVENVPRAPNGKHRTWAFQGLCKEQPVKKDFAYELDCGSSHCHITIQRWQKKRVPTEEEREKEHRVRGSHWWTAEDSDPIEDVITPTVPYDPQIADTLMDSPEGAGEVNGTDNTNKREPETKTDGSPKKKKSKRVSTPSAGVALKGGSMGPSGSTLVDLGGAGECGWRALSVMIAIANAKDPTTAKMDEIISKVETLSTTLRAKTVNFLTVNCRRWQADWIPDPQATSVTEGGVPAGDLQTFISEVLPRERRWVCGLCLAGVSLMQGCTIVVWQYNGTASETHNQELWKRAAVIRGKKETAKQVIIPVVLHYGHYYALRIPALRKSWPKEWALTKDEDKDVAVSQEMDNAKALDPLCRGGGKQIFCTPKKNKKTDDIEQLLRTCSSRATEAIDEMLKSCKTIGESDDEQLLRTCSPATTVKSKKSVIKHTIKKHIWSCPVCEEEVDVTDKVKACRQITDHLKRRHPWNFLKALSDNSRRGRHGSGLGMVRLVAPTPFQQMEHSRWANEADFICPYCEEALPRIGTRTHKSDARGYLVRLSKKQHLRHDCKYRAQNAGKTLRQYHNDFWTKYGTILVNTKDRFSQKFGQKAEEKGHVPVVFHFAKRAFHRKGRHEMVCMQCRKSLNEKLKYKDCPGVESRRSYSPGPAFWKHVEDNHMKAEVMKKMKMTRTEVAKAYEALKTFRTQPSKRRLRAEAKRQQQI